MSVQLTNSLDQVTTTAMSPITNYPQSAGGGEPFATRAKRAASPQRISNGYTPTKSNGILSPRKTSKRFFRRPTLEKSPSVDFASVQANEKKKQSAHQPKVEIIYKDSPQSESEAEESNVASLKKAFEVDGSPCLRSASTHSGERTPSTISDESAPCSLLGVENLDVNMNRVSSGSSTSHTERVVLEILSTEKAYVQHLRDIIEGYLKKMRKQNSPFPAQDVKDLFMNIEEIYKFNKAFLAELEECGDDPVDVARHFVSKEEGFKRYTEYCTNYPVSMEVLTKSTQQKETADFLKKIQVELGHSLPLGSYLLKPVQRILKYHLLLQDIQKHFDEESCPEGYEIISDALSAMTGVAVHINEMKRQHEVAVHVQEIQSQMSDFEGPDLTTYGSLVLEDTFRMHGTRTDRYLFLFEKILLITKRKETGYSCKATLMLSNMMMLESVPKEPLAFEIIRFDNQKITYTFLARNGDQKHKWTLELKRLIVDSLAAQVPKKAKALILGKESVEEKGKSEAFEGKKRSGSTDKLTRGTPQLKVAKNSRILVTVTADYVDVKPLRTSFDDINQMIQQTVNQNTEFELRRLDRVAHELTNRNACHWLYSTLAKQYNNGSLVDPVNRRNSDPFQENLKNKMNFNSKRLNVEVLYGFSSIPRNFAYTKGSSVGLDWKKKQEASRKSDDESEPRSPSDVYSSDDDKKPARPYSLLSQSDREGDLEEECEETPEDESGVSSEPGRGHAGDLKKRLSSNDPDEDENEEKSQNSESPTEQPEQTTSYSIQNAQGEVLGTATTDNECHEVKQDDAEKEKELSSPEKDPFEESTEKRIPPVPRIRSSSLTKCEELQTLRKKRLSGVSDDEAASERARADSPNLPRRTSSSGHRLLEAKLSTEKSSSAYDLRGIEEDSPAVFSHSEITSFMEYSAIQTTVRKVSRAFSGSSPPAEKNVSGETCTAQTRYIVESRSSPDKNTSFSSSDSSQNNLDELLASIDRDLDETRRTISCAQLLESALLIKNEGQPLALESESTDTLRRRRLPRIIDFSEENGVSHSNESENSTSIRQGKSVHAEHGNRRQDEADASINVCQKLHRAVVADFNENTQVYGEHDITQKSRRSEPRVPEDNHGGSKPQDNQGGEFSRTIENTPVKKRVFELFADSNNDKSKQLRNVDRESSSETEPEHAITPRKSTLPNVHQMARQYSRLVADKNTVDEIRMRASSKLRERVGSVTFESSKEDSTDHTPKIKIEKITKVSFTSTPIESYKLVRRRRRRSGSSRHRSDDLRRQSWSVEKVKPDSEEPPKARPKSVYDIEALEATLTENLEQIEEGLEPMLIEGLEKDDVVVRGLVQHLVNKFNTQKNAATS